MRRQVGPVLEKKQQRQVKVMEDLHLVRRYAICVDRFWLWRGEHSSVDNPKTE